MATRSAHGDGSCKIVLSGRHKGKWRVQVSLKREFGTIRKISRLFPTQHDGKEFLRSLIREDGKAESLAKKELTLSEWFRWLAKNDWPDTLDAKTIHGRLQRFEKFVEVRWGKYPLTKIDPMEVKEFYADMRLEGIGHATREAIRCDLVRAFNQAVSPYRKVPMIWGNPFRLTMDSKERRDAIALTPDEASKALRSPKLDDSRRAMLGLFLLGGLRLSEQMAFTVRQVNFEEGLIYIDQAIHIDPKGHQTIELPKGDKKRVAVMTAELADLLRPICAGKPQEAYLWPALAENKPRMKKLVYATWRTIIKATKLPDEMSPHDCRLSHINWIEKLCPDVSETTMKEHVGHAAIGVTQVNYTRPITPAQDLLRASLSRIIKLRLESKAA